MWHPFIDSWNLLKIERVQFWTEMSKSFFQNWKKVFSKMMANDGIGNVYGILETVISYVLLRNA